MVSIFGLLSWISILISHVFFVKARRVQGITKTSMAYVAPLGIAGSMVALVFCCVIAITKNFTAFLLKKPDGSFDTVKFTEEFVTG
jgi:yeast amino acid transporter